MRKIDYLICFCVFLFTSFSCLASGVAYLISGPSAAGKTTLANTLTIQFHDEYNLSNQILYTTRAQRSKEIEGVDYYFLSKDDFKQKELEGLFLHVFEYDQFLYGYGVEILDYLKDEQSLFILTTYDATKILRKLIPSAVSIWIDVESLSTLEERLLKRHSDDLDKYQRRYALAIIERSMEIVDPSCEYHVLNDDFDQAILELSQIIRDSQVTDH